MHSSDADLAANSILKGVNELIDSALDLKRGNAPRHELRTSCSQLTERPMTGFDASPLIAQIYKQVRENWDNAKYHKRSEENWRFEKQTRISSKGRRPEARLERAIVNIPDEIWADSSCWVNQVPVASGLIDPKADGSRRIDLVQKCGDKAYEFIELKIRSDTPLYAAMEILKYGVLYIFCRHDERALKYIDREGDLLKAEKIYLKVLAPAKYYEKYDLSWLEKGISSGFAKFLTDHKCTFEMDFQFETLTLIQSRSPVTWKVSA